MRQKEERIKVSFYVPLRLKRELDELAKKHFRGSLSQTIRKALSILKIILENMGPGTQLMIVDKEGGGENKIILVQLI